MGSILSVFLVLIGTAFAECDKLIVKVAVPLQSTAAAGICFDEYFGIRDLANKSMSAETGAIYSDTAKMQFDDMFLFSYEKPMNEDGRIAIISEIFETYKNSLKNENGKCSISIFANNQELTLNDFTRVSREEAGQPGTRLIVKSEDLATPRWELNCPNAQGEMTIAKTGDYFFLFVDVYENIGTQNFKNHLSKYLFSYR